MKNEGQSKVGLRFRKNTVRMKIEILREDHVILNDAESQNDTLGTFIIVFYVYWNYF